MNAAGEVEFNVEAEVEAQHPHWGKSFHKGCRIESKQDDGSYTVVSPPHLLHVGVAAPVSAGAWAGAGAAVVVTVDEAMLARLRHRKVVP